MATARKRRMTYSARWRDAGGASREQSGFATKREALDFAELREAEGRIRRSQGRVVGDMTLRQYVIGPWAASLSCQDGTRKTYEDKLNRFILPSLGNIRLQDLRHTTVKKWLADLEKVPAKVAASRVDNYTPMVSSNDQSLSPSYVTSIRDLLASIMKSAVQDGLIDRSPFDGIKRKKPRRLNKAVPLADEMVEELLDCLRPQYRAIVLIGVTTAMRPSEILGLTWDRLDFDRATITVDRQLSRDGDKTFAYKLKTDASYRTIDLPQFLQQELTNHRAQYGLGPQDLLFKGRSGEIFRYKRAQEMFRKRFKTMPLPPRTGMHVLRHTGVSHHIRNGANVIDIQELCGHESLKETLDTYAHMFPSDQGRLVDSMDELGRRFAGPRIVRKAQ